MDRLAACPSDVPEFSFAGRTFVARLVEAYDGDSQKVVVDFDGTLCKLTTRLAGIDTAEMRSSDPAEKAAAVAARNFAVAACGLAVPPSATKASIKRALQTTPTIVRVECGKFDKYGRILAKMYPLHGDRSVNDMLVESGHAVAYDGGAKAPFRRP